MAGRSIGSNLLLTIVSTLLMLPATEGLLRLTLSRDDLVGNFPENPELNQWKNELRFWEKYHDHPSAELNRHDPLLGWDSSYDASRVRGGPKPAVAGTRRAVAMGDSFTWGNEVEADENFVALLDRADNGLQVLNMGVPGYGIDQSYLKYRRYGAAHHPDIVLFGIYVSDYERSTVAFTAFSKPRFVLRNQEVLLSNQPVPAPAFELGRIEAVWDSRLYLTEFSRNLVHRLTAARDHTDFFKRSDRIVGHILQSLRDSLEPEQQLLVLHIPRGESFTSPDPFYQEMHRHLLQIYQGLGLPFIDLGSGFLAVSPPESIAIDFYVIRPSGSVGHLNPAGHRRAAELISERLGLTAPTGG